MLKEEVERYLKTYAVDHPDFSVNISKMGTDVYKNGIFQMSIYYRTDALRIEIKPGTTQHGEYETMLQERLVYQKGSANPYSTAERISFFVAEGDIPQVLRRLLESKNLPTSEQMVLYAANSQQHRENKSQRQMGLEPLSTIPLVQSNKAANAVIQVTDDAVISSGPVPGSRLDALKQMPYKDIGKLFYDWLTTNGISPVSASTNVSDCFYVWRKESPAQFWTMVESDDSISRTILYETLSKHSTADPDRVIAGYIRAVQRFRSFVFTQSGSDIRIPTHTEDPYHLESQQTPIENAAAPAPSVEGNLPPQQSLQQRIVVHHAEDSRRIEAKLDSLIGAIATMYSEKSAVAESEEPKEETGRRFWLEPTQGNAPVLMLRKPIAITGLIFALKLYAIGFEGSSEQYRVFFANSKGEQLSEAQLIEAVAGEECACRFELKSSASEEKAIYLAVQGVNASPNEAKQLIEFPVKIAFSADFDL